MDKNDMRELVKLAIDARKGSVEKYSVKQANDTLREALVELNGGETKLNYKAIRDGKCNGLFALVETILDNSIIDGLQEDDFFMSMVDFRNVALGDENIFAVDDNNLYVVAEVARGTQGIRRQRLAGVTETPIPTTPKAVRIYEELDRVLSGRVDFNKMIDLVDKSYRQKMLQDIYSLWATASGTQMGNLYFPAAGSYNEGTLLTLIEHVEAAAGGKTATLVGTKAAIRSLVPSIVADGYKDDIYNLGYAGKFYGSPVVALPQRHLAGTTTFAFSDNVVNIIAGPDKPIKFVYEGDPIIKLGDPLDNADLTQEYLFIVRYGMGIVLAGGNSGIGRYTMQ